MLILGQTQCIALHAALLEALPATWMCRAPGMLMKPEIQLEIVYSKAVKKYPQKHQNSFLFPPSEQVLQNLCKSS